MLLTQPLDAVLTRARRALARLDTSTRRRLAAQVVRTSGQVGGGALPTVELPTGAIAIGATGGDARRLDATLRQGDPPVLGRIADDRLLLDFRTVLQPDVGPLIRALAIAAAQLG
jgi:L-seryl-tRNA(Ser) seleniumtransferase